MSVENAIRAFSKCGLYDAADFDDFYCGSFDFECDIAEYLFEQFVELWEIPEHVEIHLNRSSIYNEMTTFDYYVIENGGEFHLFMRKVY